jgi:hypothetical protein
MTRSPSFPRRSITLTATRQMSPGFKRDGRGIDVSDRLLPFILALASEFVSKLALELGRRSIA